MRHHHSLLRPLDLAEQEKHSFQDGDISWKTGLRASVHWTELLAVGTGGPNSCMLPRRLRTVVSVPEGPAGRQRQLEVGDELTCCPQLCKQSDLPLPPGPSLLHSVGQEVTVMGRPVSPSRQAGAPEVTS